MSDVARWEIDELMARYELEPELQDFFVEGQFDKDILFNVTRESGISKTIYDIGVVNIPNSLVSSYGLTSGNKQRVIALAKTLSTIKQRCSYTCWVDKDQDHWLGNIQIVNRLKWSCFCDIESHFITKAFVEKILITGCKSRIPNFDDFFSSFISVLQEIYALRVADKRLGLNLKWIDFSPSLSIKESLISFDSGMYSSKVLNSNAKLKQLKSFAASAAYFIDNYHKDCRFQIRGHDFVWLSSWSAKKFKGIPELASESAIERILVLLSNQIQTIRDELLD